MTAWCRGQQVVCIKKDKWSTEGHPGFAKTIYPRYGNIYTIHSIETNDVGHIMLTFEETKNNRSPHGLRIRFYSALFRPILDHRDMKSLTKYLENPRLWQPAEDDKIEASAHRRRLNDLISKGKKEAPRSA